MKLDRRAIALLSSLDDDKLRFIIKQVAKETGIDVDALGLNTNDVKLLRKRLAELTDDEIAEAERQINQRQGEENGK